MPFWARSMYPIKTKEPFFKTKHEFSKLSMCQTMYAKKGAIMWYKWKYSCKFMQFYECEMHCKNDVSLNLLINIKLCFQTRSWSGNWLFGTMLWKSLYKWLWNFTNLWYWKQNSSKFMFIFKISLWNRQKIWKNHENWI